MISIRRNARWVHTMTRYDRIGHGYATRRQEDPALGARILRSLGAARTVVNVGAGAGSYEPHDRRVIAIEPSAVMARQRSRERPAIRASAAALPLHDDSVDAAMTVLSLHHWQPHQSGGVAEMCRVARDTIVIVTIDATVSARMWLMERYLREVRDLDLATFPAIDTVVSWLDRPSRVHEVLVPRDTPDHTLISFWAHPERVLDPEARAATSGFARQPADVVQRVVRDVERDLATGVWDARYGALRQLDAFDAGLRLIEAHRS